MEFLRRICLLAESSEHEISATIPKSKVAIVSLLSLALLAALTTPSFSADGQLSLRARFPDLSGKIGQASLPAISHDESHVLVRLKPNVDPGAVFKAHQPIFGNWYRVPVTPGRSPEQEILTLASSPEVATVEFNYLAESPKPLAAAAGLARLAPKLLPNDPGLPAQWHFAMVQMPAAWDLSQGAGVRVAVIDSGVSRDGEDLKCRTFVDEYDAFLNLTGPGAAQWDATGHGTHVAGTIAQCSNNGRGVAGIAFSATIIPIITDNPDAPGSFDAASIARAISWARTHGAKVINMSIGSSCNGLGWPACSSSLVNEAVAIAAGAGVVIVGAAGNDSQAVVGWPANHPDVIAVSAVDLDSLAPYSNFGAGISLAAPGGNLVEDLNSDGLVDGVLQETFGALCGMPSQFSYCPLQGTSMAAPHVAGAAALLRAYRPNASAAQVRRALEESALDVGSPGFDPFFGNGLLQVRSALLRLEQIVGGGGGDTSPCVPDELTLCAVGGRFEITSTAPRSLFPGLAGRVSPVIDADLGGAFHYFAAEKNFHTVVKVALRPSGFYAVSAVALDPLEWTVRIRDTMTGEVKSYTNPEGGLGVPTDSQAFEANP